MHYLEHKKEGKENFMAVKLDMSKAYDRVEWGFIERVMEKWVSMKNGSNSLCSANLQYPTL